MECKHGTVYSEGITAIYLATGTYIRRPVGCLWVGGVDYSDIPFEAVLRIRILLSPSKIVRKTLISTAL
jgi:hypothetical protein